KFSIASSPIGEVLIEQSVYGYAEMEFVVIIDSRENTLVVSTVENIDPAGVHSGDSTVVAPAQTFSTKEICDLEGKAVAAARALGIRGCANVRFAVNRRTGETLIISVNPTISRTTTLVSRVTGYPVARVVAGIASGSAINEIKNPATGRADYFTTPDPDYCAVKMSRFAFEKFPKAGDTLTTSMKSIGEAVGLGRTFKEALQKAMRALESRRLLMGFGTEKLIAPNGAKLDAAMLRGLASRPNPARPSYIRLALLAGVPEEEISEISGINPWFIRQIKEITVLEAELGKYRLETAPAELLLKAKQYGFSDRRAAELLGTEEKKLRKQRKSAGVAAAYNEMDAMGTGASEAAARYSSYEKKSRKPTGDKKTKGKVIILGGGPNRIGQGIEFDYCCVHAAYAIKEAGYMAILINSNPETVSTDFDTSDRLYFEPLTFEDVMNIIDVEKPHGVIVQLGGQTPLNLATSLMNEKVPILGTSPESIDRAEDRKKFKALLDKLNLMQPDNETAEEVEEAVRKARQIGYPLLVRPSYVLGGRAMQIVYEEDDLREYMARAVEVSPGRPVLLDRFLDDAIEIDVDAVADGERCVVCGVMEHIEQAGIHSGDSACCLPPYTLSEATVEEIKGATRALARELNVVGLMNVQYAVKNGVIYVLEVNPRASRTIPFVSKSTGIPWAKVATRVMLGESLKKQGILKEVTPEYMSVKEAVFPFVRFPGVDATLGPEMLSTGEVMGIDIDFGMAYLKSQLAAGQKLPKEGNVFISVNNNDKRAIVPIARKLIDMGFKIVATSGTASTLQRNGIDARLVYKLEDGRPNVIDIIKNNEVALVINTPAGKSTKVDEAKIRSTAVARDIPLITTLAGAQATVQGMEAIRTRGMTIRSIQEYHKIAAKGVAKTAQVKRPKKAAPKKKAAKKKVSK
ncbi:MAG TPA: carbamoyl-phosphate synthase large subunit, partial [bacterium]|nr:carbamoyl-phosphate synthase large subunit [bacterium]